MNALERLLKRYMSTGAAVVVVVLGSGHAHAPRSDPASAAGPAATATAPPTAEGDRSRSPTTTTPTPTPTAPAGDETAAAAQRWGKPVRVDDFTAGTGQWQLYDGTGYDGKGRRSPSAVAVRDGVLTITGDAAGTTEGMCWGHARRYGRWEVRMRAPAADPSYHAVLLLWPESGRWPDDGEVDFMETGDPARRSTGGFVHYGRDNRQAHGVVEADATRWHNWAAEWSPSSITMFLDGRPWFRSTDRAVQPPGPMQLCVQLDWFPKGDGPVRTSTMQVDRVREYSPAAGSAPTSTGTRASRAPRPTGG